MIFTTDSSLKGLVTDAKLPYSCREVRIHPVQQQQQQQQHHQEQHQALQAASAVSPKRIGIPTQPLTSFPGRIPIWPKMRVEFNRQERGISFNDIQRGSPSLLRSGNAPAFPSVAQDRAEFRIVWPGYGHLVSTYSVPTSVAGRPLTRWELACKVVDFYASFWESARRAKVSRGNERWAVKGFDFGALVLTSIHNTDGHDAVFQAVVETAVLL